ncbi:MAG: helix-turn-helix transcriptional regulator [Oscillospiraceae bacterium]|nr:helix-turn-helix transcriptional regulator [Oscillospiraceae bacterium]
MDEIRCLQEALLLVRRATGWTAEELGERIGVTRQTINNLESGRNKLTKTQYIAIRSVLDAEINKYPDETEMLQVILNSFVDCPEAYSQEDKEKILNKANLLAPAILAGTSTRKDVSKEWLAMIGSLGVVIAAQLFIGSRITSDWLKKLSSNRRGGN